MGAKRSDSRKSWRLVGLACLLSTSYQLLAQEDLPQPKAWQLLPAYYNAGALAPTSSYSFLYSSAGADRRLYLLQADLLLEKQAQSLRFGATLAQHKSHLWQGDDLTARASYGLIQRSRWGLRFGAEVNLARRSFDGARALSEGISDTELPTTRVQGRAFDLGLGVYFTGSRLGLGLSALHLLGTQLTLSERLSTRLPTSYHLLGSYLIGRYTTWSLRPAAHLRWSSQLGHTEELSLGLHYGQRYQLQANWHVGSSWGLAGAVQLGHFLLGYSWDRPFTAGSPQHELLLSYRLPTPSTAHKRPTKYTSLRLL